MAALEDEVLRIAAVAAYFGRLQEAHDMYSAAGWPDLALQLYAQYGNWLGVRTNQLTVQDRWASCMCSWKLSCLRLQCSGTEDVFFIHHVSDTRLTSRLDRTLIPHGGSRCRPAIHI